MACERAHRVQQQRVFTRAHGYGTPALIAHDTEHAWRSGGERAIREEMERRLAVYFTVRLSDRLKRHADHDLPFVLMETAK
jgi:hypothetical protein